MLVIILCVLLAMAVIQRDQAREKVSQLEQAETEYKETINALTVQEQHNDKVLHELRAEQGHVEQKRATVRKKTEKTKKIPDIKDLMDTPLPASLRAGGGLLGQDYTRAHASP